MQRSKWPSRRVTFQISSLPQRVYGWIPYLNAESIGRVMGGNWAGRDCQLHERIDDELLTKTYGISLFRTWMLGHCRCKLSR
jgi:hypothetical protein